MRNKLKFIVLLLLLCLGVTGCKDDDTELVVNNTEPTIVEATKESDAKPILYRATDGKYTIYLFGSIHVADKSAYEMNKTILDAYKSSDALAVEFDIIDFEKNLSAQLEVLPDLMYPDGSTLKDNLKADDYQKIVKFLKDNDLYNKAYEVYKPVFISSLVESVIYEKAGLDAEYGIDNYFLKKAKNDKKMIFEVESPQFQYEMMGNFPDQVSMDSIMAVIDDVSGSAKELRDLFEAWKSGNEEELVNLLFEDSDTSDMTEEEAQLYEEYNDMMVTKRNIGMADTAEGYFKAGKNVFFVVGLAHIIGDGGIVDLLEQRGYQVERIEY